MATTKITSPDLFELGNLNTSLKLPSGTTAERPTSPSTGEWRYNTTTNLVEFWDGGEWRDLQSEDIPPTPSEKFNTVLYDGNGSTQSITGVGFKPDFVWIKERGPLAENHNLTDSSRGTNKIFNSNNANAEVTSTSRITSFDSDGFTLGNNNETNDTGSTYIAWCWKANGGTTSSNTDGDITTTVQVDTKAKFSITTFGGQGSPGGTVQSFGHGLGATPDFIYMKRREAAQHPAVFAKLSGVWYYFDGTSSTGTGVNYDSNVTINSSTVTLPSHAEWYADTSNNYVYYLWSNVAQFSQTGVYTGTGSSNVITTGFNPAFVMIKRQDSAGNGWLMFSNKLNTSNPINNRLEANSDQAEQTNSNNKFLNFYSNGFSAEGSDSELNVNGGTYMYFAFASDASAAPALPDSFANKLYTGNGGTQSITGLGFSPSLVWLKQRSGTQDQMWYDSNRGAGYYISSNSTGAQGYANTTLTSFDSDGFSVGSSNSENQNGQTFVAWNWKANAIPTINTDGTIQSIAAANQAAGFSIVKWNGTGSAATVGHGLSAAPEIILTKRLNGSGDWYTFSAFANGGTTPANYFLKLNSSDAEILNTGSPPSVFAGTVPTATVFSVGSTLSGSTSDSYIAYCVKSTAGFSKVGTYTGNGSSSGPTVTTGFQPSWIMIKRTDGATSWAILDSARGGNQELYANLNDADNTFTAISFLSTGFQIVNTANGYNANGSTYLYMAFKENPAQYAIPSGQMGYLVAAGGGGSSSDSGGGAGAGAGGLRTTYGLTSGGGASAETNLTLATGTYTITVGAGGTGTTGSTTSTNGVASTITGTASVSTVGGGGGGDAYQGGTTYLGKTGGSGGGSGNGNASVSRPTGGAGTANEGFAGGGARDYASGSDRNAAGGGGGATSVGITAQSFIGGNGGFGLTSAITGNNISYAGGGGGGCRSNTSSNVAGQGFGGGGNATNTGVGNPGTANTGGGAGGGRSDGANGGSGIVVLRMNTSEYSGTTTGSPTVTTVGTETVLTFTGSGTYVHS